MVAKLKLFSDFCPVPAAAFKRPQHSLLEYSKLVLYGAFVWTHGALNSQKRRFVARADEKAEISGALTLKAKLEDLAEPAARVRPAPAPFLPLWQLRVPSLHCIYYAPFNRH